MFTTNALQRGTYWVMEVMSTVCQHGASPVERIGRFYCL